MRDNHTTWQKTLQSLVYLLLFIILSGWLLKVGQSFLLPVFIAAISMYILVTMTEWLGRLPLLSRSPTWFRRILVLIGFLITVVGLSQIILTTGEQIMVSAPVYQANLEKMLIELSINMGWSQDPDWKVLREMSIDKINMQYLLTTIISALSSFTGMTVLVVVYALFMLSERGGFATKFALAFPGKGAARTKALVMDINRKIGDYLAVKTLINIILAVMSLVILWLCGVEHALFWALIIGLLNYIPYIGSLLGVVFPVLLALVQFGSIQMMLLVASLLTIAQMYTGNILEPKMIGKQINLSPFVVLVSLSLWSSLWGVAGAILAVPLTSILVIILGAFKSTRSVAILLMDDPSIYLSEAMSEGYSDLEEDA
ncbi:putative PurR-regulated permease PerM [Acinetobacter calcoaceticus]|uniref:Putative PurR-regulated permease PerM n=1 Tax=Acinetobacter calcoaceticus TaxID=471 RepID=A0A4R1XPH3_ACICA|nr:putative PurR-regulated permease PerM [Acinetobacter calcoaceticus]